MNGEPRDEAASASDHATKSIGSPSDMHEADGPLPVAINTDRITKTAIKEDWQLAPLFNQDATTAFRDRWDLVQKGFVDDPKEAVHAADELVAQVTKTLTETFAHQRADLEKSSDGAGEPTTENLRIALRQYRSFFERLLAL
jgi:hypothetical protein